MRLATRRPEADTNPGQRYAPVAHPRRPLALRVLGLAVAVFVIAWLSGMRLPHRHHGAGNETVADSLTVYPDGTYTLDVGPGGVALGGPVGFEVTKPITLLDVRPYRVTRGVTEIVSRAFFYGFGTSPSGRPMFNGAPGSACSRGPWPTSGYGPSYPTEGLTLAPGDPIKIGFFVHVPAVPGRYFLTGYRITYRTANGKVRTVTGDTVAVDITVLTPAQVKPQRPRFFCPGGGSFEQWPKYPS